MPVSTLRQFLGSHPTPFLVAISGGADSVALMRAAHALAPDAVMALHCDHGLRGAESSADARFVEELCERLGISIFQYKTKLGKGAGLEERARLWRHACFAHASQASGAKRILLAHHAADQAETLLMNLARGAGLQGAAAMQAWSKLPGKNVQLGRPFLALMPQALRAYLKTLKQPWREDSSNKDTRLLRNKVRQQIMPLLTAVNAKAVEHLAAFSSRLKPAAEALPLDSAARQRVKILLEVGQGQTDLGKGWVLSRGSLANSAAWTIDFKPGRPTARKLKEPGAYWFSPDLLSQAFRLRGAKVGERMRPFGFPGTRLVRDLLAEAKVSSAQRAGWPVLAVKGKIVAVLGVRRGQGFEAEKGKPAWRLSWKKPV